MITWTRSFSPVTPQIIGTTKQGYRIGIISTVLSARPYYAECQFPVLAGRAETFASALEATLWVEKQWAQFLQSLKNEVVS